ncbi:MAG: hypothetical protein J0L80_02405 [Chitinophagales bacterium]|nr:hypothetical protein [Chitinophagales bacterium]
MKKIHIDSSILSTLSNVSDSAITFEPEAPIDEGKTDPKYCRISLFAKGDDEQVSLHVTKTIPAVTIYRIKNYFFAGETPSQTEYQKRILQIIKNHVQKYGTIEEIRIVGHGSQEWVHSERDSSGGERLSTGLFLIDLEQLGKDIGVKITNRIVFDACQTFVSLNDTEIRYYSEYAKKYKVQIVGTTSNTETLPVLGLYIRAGRYVQFSPNGKIIWDKLDAPYKAFFLNTESDKSWTGRYINHTPKEGEPVGKSNKMEQER